MCHLFFFFFSDQFEAHLCVLLRKVNGYFPQGYLTAELVCSPGALSAWSGDRICCRQISGLALVLPFPQVSGLKYADES